MKTACFALPARLLAGATLLCAALAAAAADWPQYRGPHTDGTTAERIQLRWPETGPRRVWTVPTPGGFSGFAVAGDRAFTLVLREVEGVKREVCVALDASTGRELWGAPVAMAKYDGGGDSGAPDNKGGDGPRSTPAVDGDRVYVLAANLVLHCLARNDGRTLWTRDLVKDHAAQNITWQNAASPLIDGDLIFICAGGAGQSLLGLDKVTGQTVWKGESDRMTHATPVAATLHGQRQIIFLTQKGLVAVAPTNGQVLWRHSVPYRTSTAASPVVGGDIVYCSAGYGVGATAVRVSRSGDRFTAAELWRRPNELMNHWSTPVYHEGHIYGLFGFKEYGQVPLGCIELATGRQLWSQRGFGQGGTILVGRHVVALAENGDLVVVEATPRAYTEVSRTKAVAGKCWNNPAVSNGRLFARSTKEAVCLDVSVATTGGHQGGTMPPE
ncbi:MAG TPA: PQQ-binding-like beta-propeller repeat protein [Methylomirabilota bacterium]|nr:PQQ-binding-like beta-propeller repeat protein [Methylomirabilota bacterium]